MGKTVDMARELFCAMCEKPTPNGGSPLERDKAMQTVNGIFGPLSGYVDAVVRFETTVPMLRARYDGDDFKDRFASLDMRRHTAHDAAVGAVVRGNRLAEHYGVASVLPNVGCELTDSVLTNPDVRTQVADFCGRYVLEAYLGRDGREVPQAQLAQEPHLDEAVREAGRKPYSEREPLDVSGIAQTSAPGCEMGT